MKVILIFKVGLLPFKKSLISFASLKAFLKMMKNAFYFILKALFVIKLFKILS